MPNRKRKKPRGFKESEFSPDGSRSTFDLWLPIPKKTPGSSLLESKLVVRQLLQRLESTGLTHAALTHTVYGRPRIPEDCCDAALPDSLWKQTESTTTTTRRDSFKVLKRLHAVVENLSDVGFYAIKADDSSSTLKDYELVSIAPRNDATFQAACVSATAAEIITLDYTSGRGAVQLPFKIRTSDVKAAVARNAVFEIPYSPAILNQTQRKALIQTCRELQMASLGLKAKVLLSSGDRMESQVDVGAMALRTPGDLVNLMESVLRFDSGASHDALTLTGAFAIEQGRRRRFGESIVSDVYIVDQREEVAIPQAKKAKQEPGFSHTASTPKDESKSSKEDAEVVEDGYICF